MIAWALWPVTKDLPDKLAHGGAVWQQRAHR
jgi:hypothetical protein